MFQEPRLIYYFFVISESSAGIEPAMEPTMQIVLLSSFKSTSRSSPPPADMTATPVAASPRQAPGGKYAS